MKVVTLDRHGLQDAAFALEKAAAAFAPDLVVGIANGGEILADMMFEGTPHIAIKSCRRSTATKQRLGWLWAIIRHLPLSVRDAMRIVEARYLLNDKRENREPLALEKTAEEVIKVSERILIVDDAIDSGRTMKRVADAIKRVAPDKNPAIAVVTETMSQPIIRADYKLYEGVLVRFPWSKDFRS